MSHVALLIPTLDRIGGAERQVILLARGLHARGWRVSVVALSGTGGPASAELSFHGIAFTSLAMRKGLADPRGWLRLRRWLRSEQPEILHAHLPHAAWMARWSRLAAPVRVLVDTIHSSSTGTLGRRIGYRLSACLPDRVTAVGHAVRETWVAARMVSANQCIVVPNGVDTEAFRPHTEARTSRRRELGFSNEFLWFAAGRLDPVKDYATMLRAFAQTSANARLVIAGTGPLEDELRKLAYTLAIEDRVRFLGFEPDVRTWMHAADAYVLSSLWEGLPTALIEAGACGLPAVATDVPGTREVIADAETGWLVPAADPAALAAKMTTLMQASPEDRRAMGDLARQRVVERYSLNSVLDRWEALYRELIERNRHPLRWARSR